MIDDKTLDPLIVEVFGTNMIDNSKNVLIKPGHWLQVKWLDMIFPSIIMYSNMISFMIDS